jgi:hypothetical protein
MAAVTSARLTVILNTRAAGKGSEAVTALMFMFQIWIRQGYLRLRGCSTRDPQKVGLSGAASGGLYWRGSDRTVQVYKTNSRNAALLEEYLRIRGEEFLRASSQRQEDPEEVRPGAGLSVNGGIPGSNGASCSITQNARKGKPVTGVDRKKA